MLKMIKVRQLLLIESKQAEYVQKPLSFVQYRKFSQNIVLSFFFYLRLL